MDGENAHDGPPLPLDCAAIAARGLAFARRRLTRDAARRYALRQLLAVVRARAHAPPADPKSAWCRQSLCVTL